jgi:hypothetical protein
MARTTCFITLLIFFALPAQAAKLSDSQFAEVSATLDTTCRTLHKLGPANGMTPEDAPAICDCEADKVNPWLKATEFQNPETPSVTDLAELSTQVTRATAECLLSIGLPRQVTDMCIKSNAALIKASGDPAFATKYVQKTCGCTGPKYMGLYDEQAVDAQPDANQKKKLRDAWFLQALKQCIKEYSESKQ